MNCPPACKLLAFLVLLGFAVVANAGTDVVIDKSVSTTTIDTSTSKACLPTIVEHYVRNSIFKASGITSDDPKRFYLIRQQFNIGTGCFEGSGLGEITVSALPLNAKTGEVGSQPIWIFSAEGSEGYTEGYTYQIKNPGCCGAQQTTKAYSLFTGNFLASTTGNLLFSSDTRTHESRLFGIEDNRAYSPQTSFKSAMATVFNSNEKSLIETIIIEGSSADYANESWYIHQFFFKEKGSIANGVLSVFDESTLNIYLLCQCMENASLEIEIPLTANGLLDEKSAIISGVEGVSLRKITANP